MLYYLLLCFIPGLEGNTSKSPICNVEAAAAPFSPNTGPVQRYMPDPHIIGGEDVAITSHSHQVSLQTTSGIHTCGASIISPVKLVSAAQCTQNSANTYQVRAGSSTWVTGGVIRYVNRIVNHPSYSASGVQPNDISTIHLEGYFLFTSSISSIKMATSGQYIGSEATITGWGRTGSSNLLPTHLQGVKMLVIDNLDCADRTSASILPEQICVYSNGHHGACDGDNGGPAKVGNELVGIASWGITENGNCDTYYPFVYTRVSSYYSWVNNN